MFHKNKFLPKTILQGTDGYDWFKEMQFLSWNVYVEEPDLTPQGCGDMSGNARLLAKAH